MPASSLSLGQIGKGAFATVYQLATKMDGKLLAAKELEKRRFVKNGMLDKKIDNEMKIMQGLRHENIVEFVEYHDQGDFLYIIMEYVRQGDLQGYLNQGLMKEDVARSMAQQILNALTYLHRSQITHRDIKPDNILIADLNPFTVKLSDFGLSKVVKHDETFLKTFCGTLLYCAPEVFPDYGNGFSKGTKRRRGAKTYHSYSSSVDIWSFGGVLWYALCGVPPFKGIPDATGEAMYNNIMVTPLDPTPLHNAGVSAQCIDLLMRMLRTDPATRPTDRECLNHPWLNDGATVPADPTLQSIIEEDESEEAEQQLSQLRIGGEIPESDEEDDILSDEELMGFVLDREPKRVRADPLYPRHQLRDQDDSGAEPSFQSSNLGNNAESFQIMPTPRQPRLFGEIGQSALGSSGVLNAHAHNALAQEDDIRAGRGFSFDFSHTVGGAEQHGPFTAPPQLERGFSSPSLLGAESLVRDLNMMEPHSPVSRTQSPFMPATPKTPDVIQHSSLDQSSKQPSQISEPTPKARTSTLNRQISLPLTASYYYNPMDPSTHNLEYASKISGIDFISNSDISQGMSNGDITQGMSDRAITQGILNGEITQGVHNGDAAEGALPADLHGNPNREITQGGASAYETSGHSTISSNDAAPSPSAAVPSVPAELDFKPPPRRLGKLIATPDSFCPNLVLNIDKSKTSWGRLINNTVVYEDRRDTRIPKTAFIIFWYSSTSHNQDNVDELSQKGKDWTSLDNLHVGIWTCATHGISINGKHLRQKDEKGHALFGHLHTGDVVQVYHDSRGTECLKFRCEFYLGSGQKPRLAGNSFTTLLGNKLSQE